MSKEPECLIPFVFHRSIEKVILIGDHQQLRPIVKCQLAKNCGLEISLFERYAVGFWESHTIMLDEQYRMVSFNVLH